MATNYAYIVVFFMMKDGQPIDSPVYGIVFSTVEKAMEYADKHPKRGKEISRTKDGEITWRHEEAYEEHWYAMMDSTKGFVQVQIKKAILD